jgi:hypothetical protein
MDNQWSRMSCDMMIAAAAMLAVYVPQVASGREYADE